MDLEFRKQVKAPSPIGAMLQEVLGVDGRYIDHMVEGWGGYVGRELVQGSKSFDNLLRGEQDGETYLADLVNRMTGLRRRGPLYDSTTFTRVRSTLERRGLSRITPLTSLKQLAAQYYDATTQEERDEIQKQTLDFADYIDETVIKDPMVIMFYDHLRDLNHRRNHAPDTFTDEDEAILRVMSRVNGKLNRAIRELARMYQEKAPRIEIERMENDIQSGFDEVTSALATEGILEQ